MRKLLRFFKNKYEDRMWAAEEKLIWWEEHVRWFSPTYPILADISDRIKTGQREMMSSRTTLVRKYGDSGLSLAELIVVNNAFRVAVVEAGEWSNCQLDLGNFIPFFFGEQVKHLFNTATRADVCKMRIPEVNIYVASAKLIPIFEAAIHKLYVEHKLAPLTYSAPHFRFHNFNLGSDRSMIEIKESNLVQPFQHLYFQG